MNLSTHDTPALDRWPPHIRVHRGTDAMSSSNELAHFIAAELRLALAQRGRAVLSVSGGKSPVPLFEALSQVELDWIRVVVTLVDDRRVSEEHEASNARMVRRHLLQHRAAQARLMSLAGHGQIGSEDDWTSRVARADRQLLDLGPADVTVLGMGLDGHFASLFPHAVELPQALDPRQEHACLSVHLRHPPPEAPFDRISQTLAHIVRSRLCVLPLTGADKLGVLKQALNHGDPQWPVSALLHSPGFSEASPLLLWITP